MLSRTASNLYWMSRYIERAENTARILDVTYRLSLLPTDSDLLNQEWFAPLNITGSVFPFSDRHRSVNAEHVMHFLALDPDNPTSICYCIRKARESARAVRGAITSEMWEVLNTSWLEVAAIDENRVLHAPSPWFDWVKERSHLLRGVTFGTMRRDDAYDFTRLGTHIERADSTARILDVKYHVLLPSVRDVGGVVDYYQWSAVLRSLSAFESYRKVYKDAITPRRVAELMILRDDIPRSLAFCLGEVYTILGKVRNGNSSETLRRAGEMRAALQFGRIADVFEEGLHEFLTEFLTRSGKLSAHIEASFFGTDALTA
ncbi:MAG: alpha-E domain-containing protein [Pseudomonadota bacterium]|nr:alpha-E domain-containing protein [Pseudomonadota bacterium]